VTQWLVVAVGGPFVWAQALRIVFLKYAEEPALSLSKDLAIILGGPPDSETALKDDGQILQVALGAHQDDGARYS